jgi:hypothetical protein
MAKKPIPLESIDSNPRYAPAAAILRTLQEGMQEIQQETDVLRIEAYLGGQAAALQGSDNQQTKDLRERVKKHRAKAPPRKPESTVETGLPAAIAAALELLRIGTRPPRRDLRALIAQLEEDHGIVHAAVIEQNAIVDSIRNELVAEQATRDQEPWNALQLRKFRALQVVTALADEEADFRQARVGAGFVPWRSDLLPTIGSRPMLVLGSEREWDSEISRMRRQLEEQRLI